MIDPWIIMFVIFGIVAASIWGVGVWMIVVGKGLSSGLEEVKKCQHNHKPKERT